jgi:hypothetical protein
VSRCGRASLTRLSLVMKGSPVRVRASALAHLQDVCLSRQRGRGFRVRNGYIRDRFSGREVVPRKGQNRPICRVFAVDVGCEGLPGNARECPRVDGRARGWPASPVDARSCMVGGGWPEVAGAARRQASGRDTAPPGTRGRRAVPAGAPARGAAPALRAGSSDAKQRLPTPSRTPCRRLRHPQID